ncbi:hypothetical protein KAJ27_03600 [bacterium]|nr:hypothetical protein [bacterium]
MKILLTIIIGLFLFVSTPMLHAWDIPPDAPRAIVGEWEGVTTNGKKISISVDKYWWICGYIGGWGFKDSHIHDKGNGNYSLYIVFDSLQNPCQGRASGFRFQSDGGKSTIVRTWTVWKEGGGERHENYTIKTLKKTWTPPEKNSFLVLPSKLNKKVMVSHLNPVYLGKWTGVGKRIHKKGKKIKMDVKIHSDSKVTGNVHGLKIVSSTIHKNKKKNAKYPFQICGFAADKHKHRMKLIPFWIQLDFESSDDQGRIIMPVKGHNLHKEKSILWQLRNFKKVK